MRCLSSPAEAPGDIRRDRSNYTRSGGFGSSGRVVAVGEGQRDGNPKGNGAPGRGRTVSTIQTCFREEREAFIRDLQVLHRQLEAKDRARVRCEQEHQASRARARSEARAAQERVEALQAEVDEAVAAKAVAEARTETGKEGLDRQTAAVEVRTRWYYYCCKCCVIG